MYVYVFLHSGEQCLCHWIKCTVASKAAGWGEYVWLCLGPWIRKDGEGEPHSKGTYTVSYIICDDWNDHILVVAIASMHNPPHKTSLMQSKVCVIQFYLNIILQMYLPANGGCVLLQHISATLLNSSFYCGVNNYSKYLQPNIYVAHSHNSVFSMWTEPILRRSMWWWWPTNME